MPGFTDVRAAVLRFFLLTRINLWALPCTPPCDNRQPLLLNYRAGQQRSRFIDQWRIASSAILGNGLFDRTYRKLQLDNRSEAKGYS